MKFEGFLYEMQRIAVFYDDSFVTVSLSVDHCVDV